MNVLIQNRHDDVWSGNEFTLGRQRHHNLDLLPDSKFLRRLLAGLPVHNHVTGVDEFSKTRPRQIGHEGGEKYIEALTRVR